MKHQNPDDLIIEATAISVEGPAGLNRVERLRRWADALEAHDGPLNALRQIEYLPRAERRAYRAPETPMTVAYLVPDLRAAGLEGDTLGEAMEFFSMSNEDAHRLLCDCHYQGTMTGAGLAERIRHYARAVERGNLFQRAARMLRGWMTPSAA